MGPEVDANGEPIPFHCEWESTLVLCEFDFEGDGLCGVRLLLRMMVVLPVAFGARRGEFLRFGRRERRVGEVECDE